MKNYSIIGLHGLAAAVLSITCCLAWARPGELDTRLGGSGSVSLTPPMGLVTASAAVAVDQSNRTIFSGTVNGNDVVGALKGDLALDTTFGTMGYVSLNTPIRDLVIDANGSILFITNIINNNKPIIAVTRLLKDGNLDLSFGNSGSAEIDLPDGTLPSKIVLDITGSIYVSGTSFSAQSQMAIAKLNSSGLLDTTFAGTGFTVIQLPPGNAITQNQDLAIDSTGAIILNGFTILPTGDYLNTLVKLTSIGSIDFSFGAGNGFVQTDAVSKLMSPHFTYPNSIKIDKQDRIVMVGTAGSQFSGSSSFLAIRYLPNGVIDPSFNAGAPYFGNSVLYKKGEAKSVLIDGQGNILMSGRISPDGTPEKAHLAIYRLNDNGLPDTLFGLGAIGETVFADTAWGGSSTFGHNGDVMVFGQASNLSSFLFYNVINEDLLPPVRRPPHPRPQFP